MSKEVLLKVSDITKNYGFGTGKTVALAGVSLEIYKGELLVILGSSGSGKSTLLNMIGGMDRPSSGEILMDGDNICKYNDRKLTDYRKDKVGFIFQSFNLISELSARENVTITADKSLSGADIDEIFKTVGLYEKMHRYPRKLSGGEQQRVAIARALAKNSDLLLCDEPTGALDYETGKQILCELEKLSREMGKTVVIVTHTKEIGEMADRVIKVRSGRIVEERENATPRRAESIDW